MLKLLKVILRKVVNLHQFFCVLFNPHKISHYSLNFDNLQLKRYNRIKLSFFHNFSHLFHINLSFFMIKFTKILFQMFILLSDAKTVIIIIFLQCKFPVAGIEIIIEFTFDI